MHRSSLVLAFALVIRAVAPAQDAKPPLDTGQIEAITGLKGTMNDAEHVFKVSAPRTDVHVSIDGRTMEPFMGLTSWAAFTPGASGQTMVMGDLVLFQDEVNPAMSAALDSGLSVTALHNHFFYDEPKIYFMHIGGEADEAALAKGVRAALDKVKEIRASHPEPAKAFGGPDIPAKSDIPAEAMDQIFGVKGQSKEGMYKTVIGRTVSMPCGCEVGKEMGVNTWAAFAGTTETALVDGDFIVFEGELQPVLKALRAGNIDIVAIHSHMEGESPKAIYLHYWGKGRTEDLAHAVKSALDAQAAAGPKPATAPTVSN